MGKTNLLDAIYYLSFCKSHFNSIDSQNIKHDADFLIVEPNIRQHKVFKLTPYAEAYENADIIAFLVSHNEFKSLPRRDDKVILDFSGVFRK